MTNANKSRLLLVDDDNDLRETLCLILEHGGFEVRSAANVNDALKLIATNVFDVLVSDLHMPNDGDGLTVVSHAPRESQGRDHHLQRPSRDEGGGRRDSGADR